MQWVQEEAERTQFEIRRLHLYREFEKRKAQEFEEFCARYGDEEE